jgi:hypothetical protein
MSDAAAIPMERPRPGERYRIVVDDCCSQAEFVGRFAGWEIVPGVTAEDAGTTARATARFEDGSCLRDVVWYAFPD